MTLTATPPAHESRVPTDQVEDAEFTHYECGDCGFTSILAGPPRRDACPLCEGDTGRSNTMRTRPAKAGDKVEGRDARDARAATFDQAVPSGVDGLVERIARIIAPSTWRDRDLYVNIMTAGGGCEAETIKAIADQRVADSIGTAKRILAALSPVPASASDAELIARLRDLGIRSADIAADRIEALTKSPPQETVEAIIERCAANFNKLGRDANALFKERMGERKRPTWWAVNALQAAVNFCELYRPQGALKLEQLTSTQEREG